MLRYLPRRWPRPSRPALAIVAAAIVPAAALPFLTPVAAASPASVPARPGPAGGASQVLMLNGDRLIVRPAPRGGGLAALIPAPFGKAVITLHVNGATYDIPADALPYLGRALDPSLFNLAMLERAEPAGRLPVRLSFAGAQRAIPGITVTRSSGRAATGYLTASSARAFGAALYRQFRADHATAGYANSPLFAGVSIALAGAPAAVPATPQFPMHTVSVKGTNQFGRPDNGDEVLLFNADNPEKFGDPVEVPNFFFHGVAKYSVPAGHYWAITDFFTPLKNAVTQRLVVLPQFTVDKDATIRLSARAASSEISVTTPRPAATLNESWTVVRTSPHGMAVSVNTISFGGVFISPTAAKPSVGTIQSYTSAMLVSPISREFTPYVYNLDFAGPLGRIPGQRFVVRPTSLATVHERYSVSSPTIGASATIGGYLPQFNGLVIVPFTPPIPMPGLQTQYMTGGRSIVWQSVFFANSGASQSDELRTLLPGRQFTENWNQYPLHPQPFTQALTGTLGAFFSQIPSAFRTGDEIGLIPVPVSDNQFGHTGQAPFNSSYVIQQNGRRIAGGGLNGVIRVQVSARPSTVRFALRIQQFSPLSVLSPVTDTVWTMHTARQPHATIPQSWFCVDRRFNATSQCAILPMLTVSYQVSHLGLDGVAPAGPQRIEVSVGHIQLAAPTQIIHASAQVSYDNGQFWFPVTLTTLRPGHYALSFTPPAGVDVTLRFAASDVASNSISETITSAYSVGQ